MQRFIYFFLLLSYYYTTEAQATGLALILKNTDTSLAWETMGYSNGMTSPSGLPLGIYTHDGTIQGTHMIYRGDLPVTQQPIIFQAADSDSKALAISMEASSKEPDPLYQCYVTQYRSGLRYIEGNCRYDSQKVVILNSQLPYEIHRIDYEPA